MTAISLGMPAAPPPVLAPRRKTRQIKVGKVGVGSDSPISVQSMTTTLTSDVNATLQQIAELTATGCDIVRVACPSQDDADALPEIAQHSQIPVIADIHFQPKYVFAAIDAGCAAVRVNPGNIRKFDDQVKEIAQAAKDRGTSIRIGVNAGSLDKRILEKYGKATPEALVESRGLGGRPLRGARLPRLQDLGQAQRPGRDGARLRAARRGRRLAAAPRRHRGRPGVPGHHQVRRRLRRAAQPGHRRHHPRLALRAAGRGGQGRHPDPGVAQPASPRRLEIVSCPSCGRAQVDVYKLAEEVTAGLDGLEVPLRVAVMGCVVNGPGEAREADLGVASGNGKGQIFVKGEVIKTVPGVADRGDPDRGGHAHRRGHGAGRRRRRRGHRLLGGAAPERQQAVRPRPGIMRRTS